MADLATLQAEKQRREQLAALEAEKARRASGATVSTSPHAGRREKRARTIQRESQQYQNQQANKSRIAQKNENAKTLQAMGVPALTHGQERIGAGALAMQNALTFGQADRLNAGVSQAFDGGSFKDNLSNARQTRQNLREEHPVTSIGTELATYMVPGAAGYIKGAQMLGRPAVGVVGNMLSRAPKVVQDGAKYATRLGGMGAAGMADAYVYNSTIGASNREAKEGRDVGLSERNQMGKDLATHPLSVAAGPATSGIYRTGKFARSGQFTPSWVEGGSPDLPTIDVLETRAPSIRPETVSALERIVMNTTDLPRSDVRSIIEVAGQSLANGDSFAFALPRAIERELARQYPDRFTDGVPGLREQIYDLSAQRGGRDRGGEIIGGRLREDAAGDVPFLEGEISSRLGGQSRFSEGQLTESSMAEIGRTAYQPILRQPITEQRAEQIVRVLNGPGMNELRKPFAQMAAGQGRALDEFVSANPLEAAHAFQHTAYQKQVQARNAGDAVLENAYRQIRGRILSTIDDLQAPNGQTYQQTRMLYGDDAQTLEALNFGNRFLTIAAKQEGTERLAAEYAELSDMHKSAAQLSIRDALLDPQRRVGERDAARLAQLKSAGTYDALERVLGDDGAAIADAIHALDDQQKFRRSVAASTGSNTTDKANARLTAPQARSGPLGSLSTPGSFMSNAVVDAGLMIAGAPVPVVTPVRAAAKMIGKIAQPGPQIRNELADILSAPARRSTPQQATPPAPQTPPPSGGPPPSAPMVPPNAGAPLATPPISPQLGLDDLDARAPIASATPPSLTPSAFEIDQMEREALRIAEPRRLTQWVKERGGLRDNGYSRGDITSIIGEVRARPGLINNSGEEADTMARRAYEEGYFTNEPDVDDFLRALDDDFSGRTPVYSANDAQLVDEYLNAQDTLKMVEKLRATSSVGSPTDAPKKSQTTRDVLDQYDVSGMSFAGPAGKTADMNVLATARRMYDEGATRTEIWNKTAKMGQPWFRDDDGNWYRELTDGSFSLASKRGKGIAEQRIDAQTIYNEYPQLKQMRVDTTKGKVEGNREDAGTLGYYVPSRQREGVKGVLSGKSFKPQLRVSSKGQNSANSAALHEMQHAIDDVEGRLTGSQVSGPYLLQPAERRAINTEYRKTWTAADRAAIPPWKTEQEAINWYFGGRSELGKPAKYFKSGSYDPMPIDPPAPRTPEVPNYPKNSPGWHNQQQRKPRSNDKAPEAVGDLSASKHIYGQEFMSERHLKASRRPMGSAENLPEATEETLIDFSKSLNQQHPVVKQKLENLIGRYGLERTATKDVIVDGYPISSHVDGSVSNSPYRFLEDHREQFDLFEHGLKQGLDMPALMAQQRQWHASNMGSPRLPDDYERALASIYEKQSIGVAANEMASIFDDLSRSIRSQNYQNLDENLKRWDLDQDQRWAREKLEAEAIEQALRQEGLNGIRYNPQGAKSEFAYKSSAIEDQLFVAREELKEVREAIEQINRRSDSGFPQQRKRLNGLMAREQKLKSQIKTLEKDEVGIGNKVPMLTQGDMGQSIFMFDTKGGARHPVHASGNLYAIDPSAGPKIAKRGPSASEILVPLGVGTTLGGTMVHKHNEKHKTPPQR